MSVALLVVTDGRDDYLRQCVASVDSQTGLHGPITERWMFDDTGDGAYRGRLRATYPGWRHINGGQRQGCAGAVRAAWQHLRDHSEAEHVFHLEQDFVIARPVDVGRLAAFLDRHPEIAQVVLRRDAVNPAEKAAGGVVEQHPDWYTDRAEGGDEWLEHTAYWTCNPCLYRSSLMGLPWPEHRPGRYSEDTFTEMLRERGQARFAYWGARRSGVWALHIGHQRHSEAKDY